MDSFISAVRIRETSMSVSLSTILENVLGLQDVQAGRWCKHIRNSLELLKLFWLLVSRVDPGLQLVSDEQLKRGGIYFFLYYCRS